MRYFKIFLKSFLAYFLSMNISAYCQKVELTKTFNLPEQAQKGVLIGFIYDQTIENYILTYSVGNKKVVRVESYIFDKDFNFLRSDVPTDFTAETWLTKYPYFDFNKGEVKTKTRKLTEGEILDEHNKDVKYHYAISKGVFSINKIVAGKTEYEKQIPFNEFASKFKFPPSGEKGKPCSEKNNKFVVVGHYVSNDGDLFILGQNKDKGGVLGGMQAMQEGKADTKYRDCFIFHVDSKGNLINQFSYDTKWAANTSPCEQYLIEGANPGILFWLVMPNYYDDLLGTGFNYFRPDICKIDLISNTQSDFFKTQDHITQKEFKYLDPLYPFLNPEKGVLTLMGKDKSVASGKVVTFVKIKLD